MRRMVAHSDVASSLEEGETAKNGIWKKRMLENALLVNALHSSTTACSSLARRGLESVEDALARVRSVQILRNISGFSHKTYEVAVKLEGNALNT